MSRGGGEEESSEGVGLPAPETETPSAAAPPVEDRPPKKPRCMDGHRRPNGRWEARHRPKSEIPLDHTVPEIAAVRPPIPSLLWGARPAPPRPAC